MSLSRTWTIALHVVAFVCFGYATFSLGKEPDSVEVILIQLSQVDDRAIAYATFQSHNQKVVSNRHGIFLTYIQSATTDYQRQTWKLVRSVDGGRTFQSFFEETRATNPAVLETDRTGGLFLTRPDFVDGNAYLSRFPSPELPPLNTTLVGGSAGKFCQLLDEKRGCLYYFAHNRTFHSVGIDGGDHRMISLLVPGPTAVTQYPHLALQSDGTLFAAWTTNHLKEYLYRSIQAMKSTDGGETWMTLDGKPLAPPLVSDDAGPTTRISLDDELDVHSWLSAFLAKNGKLHFVYWAKTNPQRQRYLRYHGTTGEKELDIEPIFGDLAPAQPDDSGMLATNFDDPDSPLYFVSTIDDRKRLACLISRDNGSTWKIFATSDRLFPFRVYSIGGARSLTASGDIIGTFTDVVESAKQYTEPNSGTVYFFRIPTRSSPSTNPDYIIETIAGTGLTGDVPSGENDPLKVAVDLPFGVEYGPDHALYITAIGSHRVLRMDPSTGKLTSVAGTGTKGYAGDGGPASDATLFEPYEVRFDSQGNMLILEM
ncbi:MAG: hypothetical protein FJ267_06445, partial [Planctomycetes bacterium]|nr:hypothetical protein [Planctomycetota bacterium]